MAKSRFSLLCVFLILVIFPHSGMGVNTKIGSLQVFNGMIQRTGMFIQNFYSLSNHTTRYDPKPFYVQSGDAVGEYDILDDTVSVESLFWHQNISGRYQKMLYSWYSVPPAVQPIPCAPNCFWSVDETGFSMHNADTQDQQFIDFWGRSL